MPEGLPGSFGVPDPGRRAYSLVYGCGCRGSAKGRELPTILLTGRPLPPLYLSADTFTNLDLTFALGLGLYQALGYRDKEDPWDLRAKRGVSRKLQPAWDTREGFLEVGPFHLGFGR